MKAMLIMMKQSCVSYAGAVTTDGIEYTVMSGYRIGASHIDLYDTLVDNEPIQPNQITNMYRLPQPYIINVLDTCHVYDITDEAVAKLTALYEYRRSNE